MVTYLSISSYPDHMNVLDRTYGVYVIVNVTFDAQVVERDQLINVTITTEYHTPVTVYLVDHNNVTNFLK